MTSTLQLFPSDELLKAINSKPILSWNKIRVLLISTQDEPSKLFLPKDLIVQISLQLDSLDSFHQLFRQFPSVFAVIKNSRFPTLKLKKLKEAKTSQEVHTILTPLILYYDFGKSLSTLLYDIFQKIETFPEENIFELLKQYFPMIITLFSFCCQMDHLKHAKMRNLFLTIKNHHGDFTGLISELRPDLAPKLPHFCCYVNPYFGYFLEKKSQLSSKQKHFLKNFIDSFIKAIGDSILTTTQFFFFCEILVFFDDAWSETESIWSHNLIDLDGALKIIYNFKKDTKKVLYDVGSQSISLNGRSEFHNANIEV